MTQSSATKRLLWVDDDEKDRFIYEIDVLKDLGWVVTWAPDGESAVKKLAEERYDFLLLDQVFPFVKDGHRQGDVWGGCRLLAWLRRKDGLGIPMDPAWSSLGKLAPQGENQGIPVIIFSAFYDDEVAAVIKRVDPSVAIEEKPSDERLFDAVERCYQGLDNDR